MLWHFLEWCPKRAALLKKIRPLSFALSVRKKRTMFLVLPLKMMNFTFFLNTWTIMLVCLILTGGNPIQYRSFWSCWQMGGEAKRNLYLKSVTYFLQWRNLYLPSYTLVIPYLRKTWKIYKAHDINSLKWAFYCFIGKQR